VVETFGKWILTPDGNVDRARLARVVFSDPEALARLEMIVHPLVGQAVELLVRRSSQTVIVVEAIKLLESDLRNHCDSVWVATATYETQLNRLIQKRGMAEAAARQRIAAQPPQDEKIAAANVVIQNDRSFEDTWQQVAAAWNRLVPGPELPAAQPVEGAHGALTIERGRPRQAAEIAAFINQRNRSGLKLSREDVMAAFGEKAFMLLRKAGKIVALAGWQVENLVARTSQILLEPDLPAAEALQALLAEVERASSELQCEASLLFLTPELAEHGKVWRALGYSPRTVESLGVRAWQEAALESMPPGTTLLFKQLSKDRVLRPV